MKALSETRRNVSRMMALLMATAMLAAACGSDSDSAGGSDGSDEKSSEPTETSDVDGDAGSGDSEPTAPTADGLTPVPEGLDLDASLDVAFSVKPSQLDPDLSNTSANNTYMFVWFDRLTEIGNDLEVKPMLATEWSYGEGGKTFNMTLREDVTFHDGTPFDAAAVVTNIERSLSLEGSATAGNLAGVAGITAVGDYEVQFDLPDSRPANLPALLATNPGAMISPTVLADTATPIEAGVTDAGSGPYKAVAWSSGSDVDFERAENFWDPGRQLVANMNISFVDPPARINGVRTGEFHVGQSAASDALEAKSIGDSGDFDYHVQVINTVYGAMLNPTKGDLASQEIRQAIRHGMDLDALNQGIFEGLCEPRFQAFPEGNPNYFAEIEERYPFDQDKARDLVAASGIADPSFDIEVSPGSYEPFSQVMQAQLADVGITMNIVPVETGAPAVSFLTNSAQSVYLVTLAQPDLGSQWANWYGGVFAGGYFPEGFAEGDALKAKALAAGEGSLPPEEQTEAWREVYTELQELALFAPGCAAPQTWMFDSSVVGVETMPFIWQGSVIPYTLGIKAE